MSQFALQLYDQYFDQVYNYVFYRVRNVQVAEDIVSEVFMKVVRYGDTYQEKAGATERSWLFAIVRNTITDYYRSKRDHQDIDAVEIASAESLSNDVHNTLLYAEVIKLLDTLPERQREIVSLRYILGLRNKEIAELLEVDQKTVSGALHKGLGKLQLALSKHL